MDAPGIFAGAMSQPLLITANTHSSDSGALALDLLHNLMVWSQQTEVKETRLKSHSFTKWWSRVGFEPSLAPVILTIIHYRLANSVYAGLVKEL